MPRIVSPPLDELHTLRTPLNEGERIVLDFFLRNLAEKWEIYIQPHLNGLRPDFVLINPNVGIAVYEVKHWDLDAIPYRIVYKKGIPQLWATNESGIDFQVTDNPVDKVIHYRDKIINLYAPLIGQNCDEGDKSYFAIVTAGLIFTKAKTERVQKLLNPLHEKYSEKSHNYLPLVGVDELQANRLGSVFHSAQWQTSRYMKPEIADTLRGWLIEPDFAQTQRQPLELNSKQRVLATTRTQSGYRQIRGSAGSGKSLVLAYRAAMLAAEGKNVLLVTYNITLWHYLRDLVVRYPDTKIKRNKNITYTHFHEWCKNVIVNGGLKHLHDDLFASSPQKDELSKVLEHRISEIANEAIDRLEDNVGQEQNYLEKYDAILVDEGQDFNLDWWNTLRRVLKKDGEMILVVDETQDLYHQAKRWTDESMKNAGFPNRAISQLSICYRMPPRLIGYLKTFIEKFLPDANISLLNAEPTLELDVFPVTLSWIQSNSEHLIPKLCAEAALNIPQLANPDGVAFPDLILLLPDHGTGLACVNILESHKFDILHVFDKNRKEQKAKKMSFFMGDSRIKACTIHSFKGWEARYIVIAITKSTDLAAAYVAMSRLKRHHGGSYLTVVCSNPELEEYGKTWESFSRISNSRDCIVHQEIDDIPY